MSINCIIMAILMLQGVLSGVAKSKLFLIIEYQSKAMSITLILESYNILQILKEFLEHIKCLSLLLKDKTIYILLEFEVFSLSIQFYQMLNLIRLLLKMITVIFQILQQVQCNLWEQVGRLLYFFHFSYSQLP